MNKEKVITAVIMVVIVILVVYFWPGHKVQRGPTQNQAIKIAAAEITQIPVAAPLTLITEPRDGIAPVENAINGAAKSVDLVMYELEDPAIEQELIDAQNRGARVRVILQNLSNFGDHPNQPAYDFLKANNVPVMWAQTYFPLTHQKTLVIDNASALIMTFNLNPKYYATSRDFALTDTDAGDVDAISATFDSDWTGSQDVADNGKDLVWSPGSADTLLDLINGATTSLDIYNEEMADPRIISALEAAAKRGVNVRVDMSYQTQWKAAFDDLAGAGVNVRTYSSSSKFYIHAKVIIADNTRAFVGSENFSQPSLDLNRELGILIVKPDIIVSLENTFAADWVGARPFEATAASSAVAAAPSGTAAILPTSTIVKLSKTGICHTPSDSSYNQTKSFTPFDTLAECLAAGGRLPKNSVK